MRVKNNLLVIGASGGVAGAFLKRLIPDRNRFGELVLVDPSDRVCFDSALSHDRLRAEFIRGRIDPASDASGYRSLLEDRRIDVAVDLSVNETRRMLAETDAAGVGYLNTGIANRIGEDFAGVVFDLIRRKTSGWRRPHILCAGMNPGIVNLWVRQGIERHGRPLRITHFEYDDGCCRDRWQPVITWSRETFVDEIRNDPAGYMEGRDRLRRWLPNPLKHRIPMDGILSPILPLKDYPRGFLLLHEENLTIAQRYDLASRFVFANDMRTMEHLEDCYDRGELTVESLRLGDNRDLAVEGSALIGVRLEYEDRWIYRFNRSRHDCLPGSSGSCRQVAAGLHAALLTLVRQDPAKPLKDRLYFCEDLVGTVFEQMAEQNLESREAVVEASGADPWPDMPAAAATRDRPHPCPPSADFLP